MLFERGRIGGVECGWFGGVISGFVVPSCDWSNMLFEGQPRLLVSSDNAVLALRIVWGEAKARATGWGLNNIVNHVEKSTWGMWL